MDQVLNVVLNKLAGLEQGQEELRQNQETLKHMLETFALELKGIRPVMDAQVHWLRKKQDQIIRDIEILAGEIGKYKLEAGRLQEAGRQ